MSVTRVQLEAMARTLLHADHPDTYVAARDIVQEVALLLREPEAIFARRIATNERLMEIYNIHYASIMRVVGEQYTLL